MANQLPQLPEVQKLSSVVIRILGGTNTYLLGTGPLRLLIDTGEGRPSWRRLLASVLDAEKASISHALLTHWHPDHVGGLGDLLDLCPNVLIYKHVSAQNPKLAIKRFIGDNQVFQVNGATLRAFHCPGHTTDHMSFILQEEQAMFTGDNVLGHGTAVFEDLAVYLHSLSRMRNEFQGRAYPGHGEVVLDGRGKIDEYIAHRQQREHEILQALGAPGAEAEPMELVKAVYKDVPEELHIPAAGGVVQVLQKLERERKVTQYEGKWRIASKAVI